ncbi:hypothetical protein EOPP23_04640 [Endozoicomonas sp. OPT23]|uniref:FlgO family outer membrane protein n=1 Tax=Endozoicomonas sp. OPT23 TaxID=2072845 RepID=UPI00129BCC0A|nr:FlgO family outer membrane protein [Endozoicomonas sp. OPT23]MRI32281.1 hypothetical protein [Endozoicomonas sp. OPT23]
MKSICSKFVLLMLSFFLTACAATNPNGYKEPEAIDLVEISKQAAKALAVKAQKELPEGSTILSTSLADINTLNSTSTFGRILSEQLSSGLTDNGFSLIEIKMRNSVYIKDRGDSSESGEFTLSRKLKTLSKNYNANAILAGTYALGSRTVYVSARLIDSNSKMVISSIDFQLPMDSDIRTLTRTR